MLKELIYVHKIPRRTPEQQGNVHRNGLHKWLTVLMADEKNVWERQDKKKYGMPKR